MSFLRTVVRPPDLEPPGDDKCVAIVARGLRDPGARFSPDTAVRTDALVAAAARHRVLVLLGSRVRAAGALDTWPRDFVAAFHEAERRAVAIECVRRAELSRVLAALAAARIDALVFKGAALAHVCYPAAHLRPRTDADVLVRTANAQALDGVFSALGYDRQQESSGQLMSYQSHYGRTDRHGLFHAFDMHWKISNRQTFADRLTFDEMWDRRKAVPALGESAATVDPAHALVLALVHRAAHHPGSRDLLWVYDVHLLAASLTDRAGAEFESIVDARGLAPIAAEGLALARDWFGTPDRDWIARARSGRRHSGADAPVVHESATQTDLLYMDLRALASWRDRLRLVREHVLPSAAYIREKYALRSKLLVPPFYVWRVISGAPRWLSRGDRSKKPTSQPL